MPFRPLLALLLALAASPARATWYRENVADGADLIMMDLRWPYWPSGTYFANWNSSFNPKPNNLSFYAGFTSFVADGPGSLPNPDQARQDSFRPGNVWTFWGSDTAGTPVRFTDAAPHLFIKNDYGGEGSSGTVGSHVWPFVQSQRWYTMLARVWQPRGGADHAFMGRWIKDHADGTWHLIGIARLPIPATSFTGNSGFLEPLESEKAVRSLHRRFGYFRQDGNWHKSDAISIDKTSFVVVNTLPEGDHEFAAIEYAQRPDLLPLRLTGAPLAGDRLHTFTVKQPDLPQLDRPALTQVQALANGRQIAVSWDVPATASPPFSYKIEIFPNPFCSGDPLTVREEHLPTARQALVACSLPGATIRLTLTDIFGQSAPPAIVAAAPAPAPTLAPPAPPTLPGLAYELFHQDASRRVNAFNPPLQAPDESHRWLTLDEINPNLRVRRGLARGFDLGVRENRAVGYALIFRGFLRVPADGAYLFEAQIDGAYRLEIDGRETLAWDGQHGTTAKSSLAYLAAGDHPLLLTHLYDDLPAHNFSLTWEGPQIPRQAIPLEALRAPDDTAYPQPRVLAEAPGDGTGHLAAQADPRGHHVDQTTLYLGPLQLAQGPGPNLRYDGPLPAGANSLWSRVRFDGEHTVDSTPVILTVSGKPVDPAWTVRNVGDAKAAAGLWQTGPQAFQFFGNGMHTVTQPVIGDFTATCRLDSSHGSHGEPVNPRAWAGLTAREFGERLDWNWGRDFHLVQTARDGLRASADFTDFGAGRITSYELPKDRPWLRVARHGDIWTAWTSPDGTHWEIGAYQFKKTAPRMDVGLFFSALPQEALEHYRARISALTIVPGVPPEAIPPLPTTASNTNGDRLTGVVVARSNPQVLVLRSTSAGLLRSSDGGRTWAPANGALTGDDLAVRSVAIHPTDPLTMIRANGRGPHSALWKSSDGGQSWARLACAADFDGVGPSALCGEILAYDLRNPLTVYLGSESRGFFKSSDGGDSWKRLGAENERITAVTVWPWEHHYPAPAQGKTHLCICTCPDRWMPFLGRGSPATATAALTSRSYVSYDNVQTIALADERDDTGFYNAIFDKALQSVNEMRYGTTHGLQTQISPGAHMALYPEAKNLDCFRPLTGLAAAALGDQKFGRCLAQSLAPSAPGRLSRSETWAFEWSWLTPQGDVPPGGLIAAAADLALGQQWWFIYTDGLYCSPDGGTTLRHILTESGQPCAP